MGEYSRRPGDKAYRIVHLFVEGVPGFDTFHTNAERILYSENEVLEVLAEDGTTSLHYHTNTRKILYYNFPERGVLKIASENQAQICARLWLRKDSTQTLYKLPSTLPVGKDNKLYATIACNTGDASVVGDQYFSKVFNLVRND